MIWVSNPGIQQYLLNNYPATPDGTFGQSYVISPPKSPSRRIKRGRGAQGKVFL